MRSHVHLSPIRKPCRVAFHCFLALFWGCLILGSGVCAQTPPAAGDEADGLVTVYIQLEGDPVGMSAVGARFSPALAGLASRTKARAVELQAQQTTLRARLKAMNVPVTGSFLRVANAVRVRVPEAEVAGLATLPGVRRVERARQYIRASSTSVGLIGAPSTWAATGLGADGRGVRLGIIDSGIDYTHADFGGSGKPLDFAGNDPTRVEPGSFPTAKVVGGFDFAGDRYAAGTDSRGTPMPDPDPLDCSGSGHGTHVAGIAAGFGVLTNGGTYRGDYTNGMDLRAFAVVPGVAPKALLYALKVFGCTGSTELVVDALEWAADPNGDFDFSDRLDVVNLSLGGPFGALNSDDIGIAAVDHLVELGCVVVISAGNDGNTFFTLGNPGVAERAITVADSRYQGTAPAVRITTPAAVAGRYRCMEGSLTIPLKQKGPITGRLVAALPANACGAVTNGAALKGQIALIDRGSCLFSDKIRNAQAAGALAVVMVNNVDGDPVAMSGVSDGITIPGVMLGKADGELLRQHLDEGITIVLDANESVEIAGAVDTLSDTSSRGPSSPFNFLKPDVSAPGTEIFSAKAGSGSDGVSLSGTSMASPAVAGAAALLRQIHPTWSGEDIKAALMNTARPMFDGSGVPYPESRMGAGRIQIDEAAHLQVTARAENANGRVGVSFGALFLSGPYTNTRNIVLTNHGTTAVGYRISISNSVAQTGIEFRLGTNTVTVPGHGSVVVPLQVVADPLRFKPVPDRTTPATQSRHFLYEASGQVVFTADSGSLHLPFYANARNATTFQAEQNRILVDTALSKETRPELKIKFTGGMASPDDLPVRSVFELGRRSPDLHLDSPVRAAADLALVGAASDYPATQDISQTTLFFGIATSGPWTTLDPAVAHFDIEVDTDNNGLSDFTVSTGVRSPDVFVSRLGDESWKLNFYAPDAMDTAVFNNNLVVIPVSAKALGLTPDNPTIRYQVVSWGTTFYSPSPGAVLDRTSWIPFNVERPVVGVVNPETTGVPILADGPELTVRLDWESAWKAGRRMPELLVFHHFGMPGKRVEVVTLDLSNDDMDNDGLPDWWEYSHFGGITQARGDGDEDRDGVSNRMEFLSGTDPKDPASALKMLSAERVDGNQISVSWSSVPGQIYTLERSSDLRKGFATVVEAAVKAAPPTNVIVDTNAVGAGPFFYRVRLER